MTLYTDDDVTAVRLTLGRHSMNYLMLYPEAILDAVLPAIVARVRTEVTGIDHDEGYCCCGCSGESDEVTP